MEAAGGRKLAVNWSLKEIERVPTTIPFSEINPTQIQPPAKPRIRYHWQRVEGYVTEADEGAEIPRPPAPSSEIFDRLRAETVLEVSIERGMIRFGAVAGSYCEHLTPAEVWDLCEALKDLANHARREPAA